MYIQNDHYLYYSNDGQQHTTRGDFLILSTMTGESIPTMRAIVRKVALTQFGHFMMGYARVNGKSIVVSGSYGSDGLPIINNDLYAVSFPVPQYLYDLWAKGNGWNSVGNEASEFRKWALENLETLKGLNR